MPKDPATNEDAYAQIIYMPGSSYPIQDKDVTLYAVQAQNSGTLMEDITIAVRNDGKVPSEPPFKQRFSKSEMKSRNASYFRNFASSCKFQCTYSFGSDHIVKENYWIKHNFTGCNDSDNEILLLYSDNVKIA